MANPEVRSQTVLAIQATGAVLDDLKKAALAQGIQLGGGYGTLAKTTFRIANFPQHQDAELVQLQRFLVGVGSQ